MSPKMSLQPLFMKLIHLLNHIYSGRIRHIPPRIPGGALKQCLLDEDAGRCKSPRSSESTLFVSHNGWDTAEKQAIVPGFSESSGGNFSGKTPRFHPKIALIAASLSCI